VRPAVKPTPAQPPTPDSTATYCFVTNDGESTTRPELAVQSEQGGIHTPVAGEADDGSLGAGDRIVVRYLDDPRSRVECYILTERAGDARNGFLSLSSPLAAALADASPGDEIAIRIGDRDRTVLYMNLVREPRRAA
jgi:Transcription elongation factor, GreA/GreB, C-term